MTEGCIYILKRARRGQKKSRGGVEREMNPRQRRRQQQRGGQRETLLRSLRPQQTQQTLCTVRIHIQGCSNDSRRHFFFIPDFFPLSVETGKLLFSSLLCTHSRDDSSCPLRPFLFTLVISLNLIPSCKMSIDFNLITPSSPARALTSHLDDI